MALASASDTDATTLLALRRLHDGRTQWELLDPIDTKHFGLDIRALPGKGLGVVATKTFSRGERLLCEAPLVSWESVPDSSGQTNWEHLERLVAGLDAPSWRAFYGLCDKHSGDKHGKTAQGIWNSNAFPAVDVFGGDAAPIDGAVRSAVYRICSRFNHACCPNSFAAWSAAHGAQTVHALRNIACGEEVTVAYVGGAEAGIRAARQTILLDKYQFACSCDACSLHGGALEASEARQSRLQAIHRSLPSSPETLVELVEEHEQLMRDEGLPLIWARAGLFLAIVRLRERHSLVRAAEFAARGARYARLALGDDSTVHAKFCELARVFADAVASPAVTAGLADGAIAVESQRAAEVVVGEGNGSPVSDDADEKPITRTYEVGVGHASFERWPPGGTAPMMPNCGPRVLHLSLMSHRQRWAHRLWPAGQVLARWLDEGRTAVGGRAVLEIGAGAALPSIVAGLRGARALVVSDYPDDKMLQNMIANLDANLTEAQRSHAEVVGYNWNKPPSVLLQALARLDARSAEVNASSSRSSAGDGGAQPPGFDLILLSDLLYECEHEPILRAVAACLAADPPPREGITPDHPSAKAGGELGSGGRPRALLTFQVHDRCQLPRQVAFFELAPNFGLMPTRLAMVNVGRQFDDEDAEDEEDAEDDSGDVEADSEAIGHEEDVTKLVQLWELVRAQPAA